MIYYLDTSAILNGALPLFENVYVSPIVIAELENIKSSTRNEQLKYKARRAVREIIASKEIISVPVSQRRVERLLKKYDFLMNINDHRMLCEAIVLKDDYEVTFVTSDGAQYLFAQELPIRTVFFSDDEDTEAEDYCGWSTWRLNNEQMALLYSNPEMNSLCAKTNEFIKVCDELGELKDILFWNGEKFRALNYKEIKMPMGDRLKPRNIEQKMYFDLLQNPKVPVKLCSAAFGTGKSLLALGYALQSIQEGRFDRLVFVKNNLEVKGAGKLGTLPGDEVSKQYPWLRQIEDHIGMLKFEEYIESGLIEPAHLSTLRGRDLRNSIILVDEAENLLATNIQLLLGRVSEGSEIIFCADVKQCDYLDEKQSGIPKMIERLTGNPLFGMVKLVKTERSEVAAMADLLD